MVGALGYFADAGWINPLSNERGIVVRGKIKNPDSFAWVIHLAPPQSLPRGLWCWNLEKR